MRAVLWLFALFGIATASALFAGNNQSTVTLYWYPHRIDLSLNLFVLLLVLAFVVLHLALRAVSGLLSIPRQARRWRLSQKERAIQSALLESLAHLVSGRFVRARKAAELVVALESSVSQGGERLEYVGRLRAIAHLLAAESAHAVQDRATRESHFQQALVESDRRDAQDVRDGVVLRAARWKFDDRDAAASLEWLDQLPQGASRRTVALRLRFKVARLAGQARVALETARLLTKHRAFTETAGRSIARGLAIELIRDAHDQVQIQRVWSSLESSEQETPEVALEAAERLLDQGGLVPLSRQWLLPIWERLGAADGLSAPQRVRLVRVLERGFAAPDGAPDAQWLTRVEAAQMSNPRDAELQYLAGVVCMRLSLWGKAQQMLKQSLLMLKDAGLRRDAWQALAEMAEHRQDTNAATHAYKAALAETAKR
ncbi:heme biosynthesis protein HemY [Rhodoferax aquaticus]|uniref:Heme biosynthesis protein HemY n=1 Tax=Rhodoferax aquaticus TaxID=2527691 RepID=A0A515ES11_9BURK|nr:heme biosynthesis HemY N-terminal domain-containing protein [Rhodoferax aquaticus]QDL55440.1 heme biosynthesis protein HemY [Rhodoferax aquaticus]